MMIMVKKIPILWFVSLAWACGSADNTERNREPSRDAPVESTDTAPFASYPLVLFLGTSLTAGLGVTEEEAFPSLIEARIVEAGLAFRVVNAGVSGETSAGGLRRIGWLLRQPVGVLVIELGANDGLRGLDPEQMRHNLQEIIDRTKAAYSDVAIVLAGMEAPPDLGPRYTATFRQVFDELTDRNGLTRIPFLLDGVAGLSEFNQSDGIHPNATGHAVVADNVWSVLEPLLEELHSSRMGEAAPASR
jgi:acyl-CoA thioesterase-1